MKSSPCKAVTKALPGVPSVRAEMGDCVTFHTWIASRLGQARYATSPVESPSSRALHVVALLLLLLLLVPLGAATAAREVAKVIWEGDPPEEEGLPPPPSQGTVFKSNTRLMLPSTLGGVPMLAVVVVEWGDEEEWAWAWASGRG